MAQRLEMNQRSHSRKMRSCGLPKRHELNKKFIAWGEGYGNVVAELAFDLEIVINGGTRVWTPIIGTINVIGDISTGGL